MILHNYDVKQSQIHLSTKDSSRTWPTSKCSRNYFHLIKMLILIIAMSFFVKTSHAVQFPGLSGLKGDHATQTEQSQKSPGIANEMTRSPKVRRVLDTLSVEKKLTTEMLGRYDSIGRVGRPVFNANDVIHIKFGLNLIQIMEVDEFNQILKLSLWYRFEWTDVVMRWTPSHHDNIQSITLPSNRIWLPDIHLYNFADERLHEEREALITVDSNGTVQWAPQAILKSSCAVDTKYFPFDVQRCSLKFGSWSYSVNRLNIDFFAEKAFHLKNYIKNNEWNIIGNNASRSVDYYECCTEPFPDVTYELVLKRRAEFYSFILILPWALLSLLTLVIFWVPPESPAKLQLGMSVFIALFFLLIVLSEIVPRAAPTIPLIGAFFCMNMLMIALSTILACVVCNMHFRGIRTERPPEYLRSVIGSRLAHLFCLHSPKPVIFGEIDTTSCVKNDKVTVLLIEKDMPSNDDQSQNRNQHNQQPDNYQIHLQQQQQQQQQQQSNYDSAVDIDNTGYQSPYDYSTLLEEIRAIRCSLDRAELDSRKNDRENKVIREWQILACIADRFFFIVYLIFNFLTIFCLFTVF